MITIRSAIFNVVFTVTFVVMSTLALPCLLRRDTSMWLVKTWSRTSVWLLRLICGTRIEFRNLHLLPKGASIIAVKHQSFLETFALISVLDDFSYVLKKEILSVPLFGWYARMSEQIGIDRAKGSGALAEMQRVVRARLAAGRQIIIFPEGTRRPVGAPPLYKAGVARLCAATNMPCTPVALNTGLFWPRHSFRKPPGTVVFEFLPPVPWTGSKPAFMKALRDSIEPATNALVAAALAKDPDLGRMTTKHPLHA